MRASRTTTTAFSASLILHGGLVTAFLLIAYAVKDAAPLVPTPTFVLTPGESSSVAARVEGAQSSAPTILFSPPPAIRPTAVREDDPAPVESTAVAATPMARPRPAPLRSKPTETTARPTRISMADFIRLHPAANRPVRATAPAAQSVKGVDIKEVLGDSKPGPDMAASGAGSSGEANLLAAYEALLKKQLRAALTPTSAGADNLATKVRFHLAADGTMSAVMILASSGDRAFDEAVLAAFARVRSIGPSPNRQAEVMTVLFTLRE